MRQALLPKPSHLVPSHRRNHGAKVGGDLVIGEPDGVGFGTPPQPQNFFENALLKDAFWCIWHTNMNEVHSLKNAHREVSFYSTLAITDFSRPIYLSVLHTVV
jgi:hypothetical protein